MCFVSAAELSEKEDCVLIAGSTEEYKDLNSKKGSPILASLRVDSNLGYVNHMQFDPHFGSFLNMSKLRNRDIYCLTAFGGLFVVSYVQELFNIEKVIRLGHNDLIYDAKFLDLRGDRVVSVGNRNGRYQINEIETGL